MLHTAATTDDSSVAIGTSTSRPSTFMLVAMPIGMERVATTFSIMWSAVCGSRLPGRANCAAAAASSPAKASTAASRSAGLIL